MTPFHGPCPWIAVRPGPWPHPTHLLVARKRRRLRSSPKFYDDTRGRNRYRGRERGAVSPCSYGICRTPARKLKIRLCYVRKKMLPVTGKRVSSWILHLILEPFFFRFLYFLFEAVWKERATFNTSQITRRIEDIGISLIDIIMVQASRTKEYFFKVLIRIWISYSFILPNILYSFYFYFEIFWNML